MFKRKVIAAVVEPGHCRYYRQGRRFTLGGFTPRGLCDSAYAVLSRDAQTMRCGGTLPWEKDGRVLTRCPDPEGALWELRLAGDAEADETPRKDEAARGGPASDRLCEHETCRGARGDCRFALGDLNPVIEQINAVLAQADWRSGANIPAGAPVLAHLRFSVATAACPNACSRPQIADVGVIAQLRPGAVDERCTGCGACARICREGALTMTDDRPELSEGLCVECGQCIRACRDAAIQTDGLRFRILAGGKLGRHPVLAREIRSDVQSDQIPGALAALISVFLRERRPGERMAHVVDRLGDTELLRQTEGR